MLSLSPNPPQSHVPRNGPPLLTFCLRLKHNTACTPLQAGARLQVVLDALRGHGWTLQNLASIKEQQARKRGSSARLTGSLRPDSAHPLCAPDSSGWRLDPGRLPRHWRGSPSGRGPGCVDEDGHSGEGDARAQ